MNKQKRKNIRRDSGEGQGYQHIEIESFLDGGGPRQTQNIENESLLDGGGPRQTQNIEIESLLDGGGAWAKAKSKRPSAMTSKSSIAAPISIRPSPIAQRPAPSAHHHRRAHGRPIAHSPTVHRPPPAPTAHRPSLLPSSAIVVDLPKRGCGNFRGHNSVSPTRFQMKQSVTTFRRTGNPCAICSISAKGVQILCGSNTVTIQPSFQYIRIYTNTCM